MKYIIAFIASFTVSVGYAAKPVAVGVCDRTSAPHPPTRFDFKSIELEAIFLDVVASYRALENSSDEYFNKNAPIALYKKANFLNRALTATRVLREKEAKDETHAMTIPYLNDMISSVGGDLSIFERLGRYTPDLVRNPIGFHITGPSSKPENEPLGFIGFVGVSGNPDTDLPRTQRRSIGFGPITVTDNPCPKREAGQIDMQVRDEIWLQVRDTKTGVVYVTDFVKIREMNAETDDRAYAIVFDENEREWIVSVSNLANPSGSMGFHSPKP